MGLNIVDRFIKAKIALGERQPWIGELAAYVEPQEAKGFRLVEVQTAGVNALGDMYYNPKFVDKLDDRELCAVFAHEVFHLAFEHPFRSHEFDDKLLWNIAADIKTNELLQQENFTLPEGSIEVNTYSDSVQLGRVVIKEISKKTTETLYRELHSKRSKLPIKTILVVADLLQGNGDSKSQGSQGKAKNGNANGGGINGSMKAQAREAEKMKKVWQERLQGALESARTRGTIPAGLEREIDALKSPSVPWVNIIRARFSRMVKRTTWSRPAKKWLSYAYFPGVMKRPGLRAVVAIDTSGSIGQAELTQFMTEVWSLSRQFPSIHLTVVDCDCEINKVVDIKSTNLNDLLKIKMAGGGGTDFKPVFRLVDKKYKGKIDCVIYLSDGYGDWPSKKPPYDVYWVLLDMEQGKEIPWGKKVELVVK